MARKLADMPMGARIPAEPFRRLIRESVAEIERETGWIPRKEQDKCSTELSPATRVACSIWPDMTTKDAHDRYRHFMYPEQWKREPRWTTFDQADRILVGLDKVGLWHSDPEFMEIYENVDFASVDLMDPICDETYETVKRIVEEEGGAPAAGRKLGVSPYVIRRRLAECA